MYSPTDKRRAGLETRSGLRQKTKGLLHHGRQLSRFGHTLLNTIVNGFVATLILAVMYRRVSSAYLFYILFLQFVTDSSYLYSFPDIVAHKSNHQYYLLFIFIFI